VLLIAGCIHYLNIVKKVRGNTGLHFGSPSWCGSRSKKLIATNHSPVSTP